MEKVSRGVKAGIDTADALVEMTHLMYQSKTANRFMDALINRLNERRKEFVPNKRGEKFGE